MKYVSPLKDAVLDCEKGKVMESSLSTLTPVGFKTVWNNICSQWAVKTGGALFLTAMEAVFGTSQRLLVVVLALVLFDTFTGVWKAARAGNVSSKGFFKFSAKIIVYWVMLATAALVDQAITLKFGLPVMISFLAITESISILENISALGWPVPTKLVRTLKDYNAAAQAIPVTKAKKSRLPRKKKR